MSSSCCFVTTSMIPVVQVDLLSLIKRKRGSRLGTYYVKRRQRGEGRYGRNLLRRCERPLLKSLRSSSATSRKIVLAELRWLLSSSSCSRLIGERKFIMLNLSRFMPLSMSAPLPSRSRLPFWFKGKKFGILNVGYLSGVRKFRTLLLSCLRISTFTRFILLSILKSPSS